MIQNEKSTWLYVKNKKNVNEEYLYQIKFKKQSSIFLNELEMMLDLDQSKRAQKHWEEGNYFFNILEDEHVYLKEKQSLKPIYSECPNIFVIWLCFFMILGAFLISNHAVAKSKFLNRVDISDASVHQTREYKDFLSDIRQAYLKGRLMEARHKINLMPGKYRNSKNIQLLKMRLDFGMCRKYLKEEKYKHAIYMCKSAQALSNKFRAKEIKKKLSRYYHQIFMEAYALEVFEKNAMYDKYTFLKNVLSPDHNLFKQVLKRFKVLQNI